LPGAEDGPQIAPILPDIVGEAAIMCWLGNGGVLSRLGIDTTASIHRAASTALGRTSQVLVRAAQDFAAAGHDEPVRWLYAMAQATEADLGALIVIAEQLPKETIALCELALDLTRSIVDRLRIVAIVGEAAEAAHPLLSAWLSDLGNRLSHVGSREEALAASQEAVDIRRRLVQTRPDAFLPDLAMSLNNLGGDLSNLGRREEALAASQEAVDIYRRLAQTRPDAFLPNLATSISVMSDILAAHDRYGEAAQAATQALEILAPFVERYPQTYRGLARTIGDDILRYSEAAGQPPGNALLARVARALGEGEAVEEESATEAMKAKVDAILDAVEKTGVLDEDALAELPSGLAEQLRAAWTAARSGSGTENPGG